MALLDMLFPQNKPGMAPANPQPQMQQGGGILAALLGQDNPAAQWASQNRNYLGTIGTGIANGLRFGDLGAARTLDTLTAQEAQQKNATQEWLAKNYPQYANLPIDQGWQLAMQLEGQKNSPKAMPDPIKLGAGETLFDQTTGQPIFTAPQVAGMAEPPVVQTRYNPQTGLEEKVQWDSASSSWTPFGGQKAVRGANDLSATETRQLFESEDKIQASQNAIDALTTALELSKNANAGFGADIGSQIGANVPDWVPFLGGNEQKDTNTLKLKNLITEQALSSLKATFGSAPTEGERQILLEIQGSVTQPQEVRESIWKRATQMAQKRIEFEMQRKAKIESGGYGMTTQGAAGGAPVYRGGNFNIVGVE